MTPADIRRLLLLAAVWGGSFLFIRVGAPVLGPILTAECRAFFAALALLIYSGLVRAPLEWRTRWRQYVVIGALNSAIPFVLLSTAEMRLTASVAAILNATTPLFGAVAAALWLKEVLTLKKGIGILIALTGVAVLVGWEPITWDRGTMLCIGASLSAALFYGLAGTYTKLNVHGASPLGIATGSQVAAAALLAFAVPFTRPHAMPTLPVILCVLALALFSTAFAYILYFRLVIDVGPTNALTVTFLTPICGVTWGVLFLGEALTPNKLLGGAIILLGTGLITGLLGGRRSALGAGR